MAMMKAVPFREFGGPEVLQVRRRGAAGAGRRTIVLVRIHAAGICYHDLLSRAGKIPRDKPGRILGHEIAGEMVGGGAQVRMPRASASAS